MAFADLPSKSEKLTHRYAGIGSRETPPAVMQLMEESARRLARRGFTLLSGGAQGADSAFERGAGDQKTIFYASHATDETRAIAREIHPAPQFLKPYPLNLMARNTLQIFGRNLDSPVDFVLCWTPDGCEHYSQRTRRTGGTGQAIEMASRKSIPVINMLHRDWGKRVAQIIGA